MRTLPHNALRRLICDWMYRYHSLGERAWLDFAEHTDLRFGHRYYPSTEAYLTMAESRDGNEQPAEQKALLAAGYALMLGLRASEFVKLVSVASAASTAPIRSGKCRQPPPAEQVLAPCLECAMAPSRWDDSVWEISSDKPAETTAVAACGLFRQQHDLSKTDALNAHLNALDEQLRS
jgi:hypothetical protein